MTRTPLRVSLFGGGTDYPAYFERRPGAVVGMAIDKYIYLTALRLRTCLSYNYRVAYSKLELADEVSEIHHPVVRAVLNDYGVGDRLDISVLSDLPANGSGLGSSSAFTVGFVNLVNSMIGHPMSKMDLAREAIRIERDVLLENVGVQDQLHAAFGGVNRFDFDGDRIRIAPVNMSTRMLSELNDSLVLIHTGVARRASDIVAEQVRATKSSALDRDLTELYTMVGECVSLLESSKQDALEEIGLRLQESWAVKRRLSSRVTDETIDAIYDAAMRAGSYGGKLCGAGGGGFVMMICPPERQQDLIRYVSPLAVVPARVDMQGTQVLHIEPNNVISAKNVRGLALVPKAPVKAVEEQPASVAAG